MFYDIRHYARSQSNAAHAQLYEKANGFSSRNVWISPKSMVRIS